MNTEIFSQINWLAIFVAALAYFMLGAIWYSKALFGSKWAALVSLDMSNPDKKKGMGKMMAGTFLLIIVTCIALAILVHRLDLLVIASALKLGLITGICFAATAVSISFIYESRPTALYFIDCGYHLAGHLIAAIILVLWQ
jgi:MFS family permease